uniref:hypothetical protein n=1 Tax=Klebsiella pneumoniae TaxID=573 RepID=UPI002232163E
EFVFELPALVDVLDPSDAGSGPVVRTFAMLLAATFARKLAAESPDVAIESMLMTPDLQDKSYTFPHNISKIRRFLCSSS